MKEIIYPRKLDVPCTQGNIFDLQEYFCSGKHSPTLARIEMMKCKKYHLN